MHSNDDRSSLVSTQSESFTMPPKTNPLNFPLEEVNFTDIANDSLDQRFISSSQEFANELKAELQEDSQSTVSEQHHNMDTLFSDAQSFLDVMFPTARTPQPEHEDCWIDLISEPGTPDMNAHATSYELQMQQELMAGGEYFRQRTPAELEEQRMDTLIRQLAEDQWEPPIPEATRDEIELMQSMNPSYFLGANEQRRAMTRADYTGLCYFPNMSPNHQELQWKYGGRMSNAPGEPGYMGLEIDPENAPWYQSPELLSPTPLSPATSMQETESFSSASEWVMPDSQFTNDTFRQ